MRVAPASNWGVSAWCSRPTATASAPMARTSRTRSFGSAAGLDDLSQQSGRIVCFVADVSIREDALVIELTVPERVLSLHGGAISVPLRHITKATAVHDVMAQLRGAR